MGHQPKAKERRVSAMIRSRKNAHRPTTWLMRHRSPDGRRVTLSFASLAEAEAARDQIFSAAHIARADAIAATVRDSPVVRETPAEVARRVSLDVLTHDCERPTTRADCVDAPRPCPWYSCRHHVGLEVAQDGGIQYVPPEQLEELPYSCALDAAERDGMTLEEVGDVFGVSRERIRQVESMALVRALKPARQIGARPLHAEHVTIWDELETMERLG